MQVIVSSLSKSFLYRFFALVFFGIIFIFLTIPTPAEAQIPAKLGVPNLADASDSNINDDDITNDNTPNILGSNVASDATSVTVTAVSGSNTVTNSSTPLLGAYNIILGTLADGDWSITVTQTNASGTSPASDALTITVDTTDPAKATLSLVNDTGTSSTDGITKDGRINVTGLETATGTSWTWRQRIDGGNWTAHLGGGAISATGSAIINAITTGEVEVEYDVLHKDTAGNENGKSITITLDTVAPEKVTLSLDNDTGSSNTDKVTASSTINVGLEPNARWRWGRDTDTWVDGSGSSFNASDGTHDYAARQIDLAGNESAEPHTKLENVNYDTTPPTVNIVLTDNKLAIGETATITITFNEDAFGFAADELSVIDANAIGTLSGFATTTDNRVYTAVYSPPEDATDSHLYITVRADAVNDLAGNANTASSHSLSYDTVAPAAPTLNLNSDTGLSGKDSITADGRINVTDLEGSPTSWKYRIDSGSDINGSGSYFTATPGMHTYSVRQVDNHDNDGAISQITLTYDPSTPSVDSATFENDSSRSPITLTLALNHNQSFDETLIPTFSGPEGRCADLMTDSIIMGQGTTTYEIDIEGRSGSYSGCVLTLTDYGGNSVDQTLDDFRIRSRGGGVYVRRTPTIPPPAELTPPPGTPWITTDGLPSVTPLLPPPSPPVPMLTDAAVSSLNDAISATADETMDTERRRHLTILLNIIAKIIEIIEMILGYEKADTTPVGISATDITTNTIPGTEVLIIEPTEVLIEPSLSDGLPPPPSPDGVSSSALPGGEGDLPLPPSSDGVSSSALPSGEGDLPLPPSSDGQLPPPPPPDTTPFSPSSDGRLPPPPPPPSI